MYNETFGFSTPNSLRNIEDDTGSYDVLALRPDRGYKKVRTAAFRTVKVTIDRSDLTVRARKGYIVE